MGQSETARILLLALLINAVSTLVCVDAGPARGARLRRDGDTAASADAAPADAGPADAAPADAAPKDAAPADAPADASAAAKADTDVAADARADANADTDVAADASANATADSPAVVATNTTDSEKDATTTSTAAPGVGTSTPHTPHNQHPLLNDLDSDSSEEDDLLGALADAVDSLIPQSLLAYCLGLTDDISVEIIKPSNATQREDHSDEDDDDDDDDDEWDLGLFHLGRRRRRAVADDAAGPTTSVVDLGLVATSTTSAPNGDSEKGFDILDEEDDEEEGDKDDDDENDYYNAWWLFTGRNVPQDDADKAPSIDDNHLDETPPVQKVGTPEVSEFLRTLKKIFYRSRNRFLARGQSDDGRQITSGDLLHLASRVLNVSEPELGRAFGGMATRWIGEALYEYLFEDDDEPPVDKSDYDEVDKMWDVNWDAMMNLNGSFSVSGNSSSLRRDAKGPAGQQGLDLSPQAVSYFFLELLGTVVGLGYGAMASIAHG